MIKAQVVGDSINSHNGRIASMVVTFPRIILAEFNTHRMFSRNSASSRAIPYKKALKAVVSNPFIPMAFQKDHVGMQGKEYLDPDRPYTFEEVRSVLHDMLTANFKDENGTWDADFFDVDFALNNHVLPLLDNGDPITLKAWWLKCRDVVVASSVILAAMGTTKQICNRLLEPFMWHTVIVTATEWENFFALRSPIYQYNIIKEMSLKSVSMMPTGSVSTMGQIENMETKSFRSRKEYCESLNVSNEENDLWWLIRNRGQAEIHMMALAEAMWNAYQESKPELLKVGEWHICYKEEIKKLFGSSDLGLDVDGIPRAVKIGSMMAARTSYTIVGTELQEWTADKYCIKANELAAADPLHASPFEHCAEAAMHNISSGNFTNGWIQYRKMLPNENKI